MSQKVASAALVQALDGSGLYTAERNLAIFEQVPPELRLTEFSSRTLPDHPAFHWRLEGRATWRGFDLGPLPEPMQRDFAYCLWRVIDSGLQITAPYGHLIKWFIRLVEETRGAGRPPLRSLIDSSVSDWERELVRERARRTGTLGWTKSGPGIFRRCYRHLLIAYDPREWWQHDAWSPRFDARIPLREHEPAVARAGYDFTVIEQRWLREALKWQLKTALETGLLRWASVLKRLDSLTIFSQFIAERGIDEPRLCADRAELRLLALDFLAHVKQRRARCGANRGELVANGTVRHTINHVERFYAFMADYKEEAARALRRAALGGAGRPACAAVAPGREAPSAAPARRGRLLRRSHDGAGHAPRRPARRPTRGGRDRRRAGDADPDVARPHRPTSRRAAAVGLRLPAADRRHPSRRARHEPGRDRREAALSADQDRRARRTRSSSTPRSSRSSAPSSSGCTTTSGRCCATRPRRHPATCSSRSPATTLAATPTPRPRVTRRLKQLGELADIRDSQGRRPPLSNVHRFRHTRATSLINAGVPVHVVQRYLGHLSAEMTMRYAHTLRETHEREFLRYKKITADGADLELDPRDLFALIELGKRTDRVLPNGLCMLPPRQTCNRGNACLTCDKFTTDASYLPEHEQQLEKLSELIAQRQAAFRARTGEEMTGSNVWLEQRLTEQRALEKIITVLRDPQLAEQPDQAVRGPGTSARAANQPVTDRN